MSGRYEFGPFQLDCVRRKLLRNEAQVSLTAKAFTLLQFLVEHHGQTVEKQRLLDTVWSGSIVEENTLSRTVSMLRKALGEAPGQHSYIVTEPGRGYRFVASVSESAPEPAAAGSRSSKRLAAAGVALIGLLGLAGLISNEAFRRAARGSSDWTPVRVTANGRVLKAAISPDGSMIAYASGRSGHESLMLHTVVNGKSTDVIPEDAVHYMGLTFARGGRLLYAIAKRTEAASVLWSIDLETGERRRILEDLDSPISFSPDGSQFVFIRPGREKEESTVVISDAGGLKQSIAGSHPEWLDYPAWSPDGQLIATTVVSRTRDGVRIVGLDPRSGRFRPLADHSWTYVVQLGWAGQRTIVFSAKEKGREPFRLWQLSIDSGEARPITHELAFLEGASVTPDGTRIVSVQQQTLSAVWLARLGGERRQITADSPSHPNAIRLTDTTILVDMADAQGSSELTIMNLDGSGRRQLATSRTNFNPSRCPDGSVLLVSDRDGTPGIWRMRPDGEKWSRVVADTGPTFPRCSSDGRWVVYSAVAGGRWPTAWKAPLNGGEPIRLNSVDCDYASMSPDGKLVACFWRLTDSSTGAESGLALLPSGGGDPLKIFPRTPGAFFHPGVHWSADGKLLYVSTEGGVARIWRQPISGGRAVPLDVMESAEIFHFDPSPDGAWAVSAGRRTSDVVLVRRQ